MSTIAAHPISTIGGGFGAYGIAKGLMSPGFARWLYRLPATVSQAPSRDVAVQRALVSLRVAMTEPQQTPSPGPVGTPAYGAPAAATAPGAAQAAGEVRGDLGPYLPDPAYQAIISGQGLQ